MSTFHGIVSEISGVSIDSFTSINLHSSIYFLSHCHSDHMNGLYSHETQNDLLRRKDVYLYASSISVQILEVMFPRLKPILKSLSVHGPNLIDLPHSNETITVTLVPAGHCPGSVMFFFETKSKNILYTGDFRIGRGDIEKYKCFHNSAGELKTIDKMYLDTTFLNRSYATLPSRLKSSSEISSLIKSWVSKSSKHVICLYTSANYGSENLFVDIFRNTGMKIHVTDRAHNIYSHITEISPAITTDPYSAQIHCCKYEGKICRNDKVFIRTIRPSVLWWKDKDLSKSIVCKQPYEFFYVCYSCHASLEEIKYFVEYLKPKDIYPCVVPDTIEQEEFMNKLIKEMIDSYKPVQETAVSENDSEEFNSFDIVQSSPKKVLNNDKCRTSSEDELFSTPPKKIQKCIL